MSENPILTYLPLNGSLAGRDRLTGDFTATGTGAVRWEPADPGRLNLAANGSAENETSFDTFWFANTGCTKERVTTDSTHGDACVHFQNSGTVIYSTTGLNLPPINYTKYYGRQVWLKFKWKGTAASSIVFVGMRGTVDSGAQETFVVPPAEWTTKVMGPFTINADQPQVYFDFFLGNGNTTDGSEAYDVYVDEVMLTLEDPTDWEFFETSTGARVNHWPDPNIAQPTNTDLYWLHTNLPTAGIGGSNANASVRYTVPEAGSFYAEIQHLIPYLEGIPITVSFDIRGSKSADILAEAYTTFGGPPVVGVNISLSTSWQRVVIHHPGVYRRWIFVDIYDDSDVLLPGDWIELSSIVIEEGATTGDWFEPNKWFNPSTGQLGTANNSASATRLALFTEEATTNLLTNPRIDSTMTGWTDLGFLGGGTATRTTNIAYIGQASIVSQRTTSTGYIGFYQSDSVSVVVGQSYTASGYFQSPDGVPVTLRMQWRDASFAVISTNSVTVTSTSWQRGVITAVAPSSAATVQLTVYHEANGTVGHKFYATCLQIEQKAYATTYCDGSLGTGYAWSGTAHASASTRIVGMVTMPVSEAPITLDGGFFVKAMRNHNSTWGRVFQGGYHSSGPNDIHYDITYTSEGTTRYQTAFSSNFNGNWWGADWAIGGELTGAWQTSYFGFNETQEFACTQDNSIQVTSWPDGTFVPRASAIVGTIAIANDGYGTNTLNGAVSDFVVFSRPITDAEYLAYYNAALAFEDLWLIYEQELGSMVKSVGTDESPTLIKSSIDTIVFVE